MKNLSNNTISKPIENDDKIKNNYLRYMKAIKYYSNEKIAFLDLLDLITPKQMLEKLIEHLHDDSSLISLLVVEHIFTHLKSQKFDDEDWETLFSKIQNLINMIKQINNLDFKRKDIKTKWKSKKDSFRKMANAYIKGFKKEKRRIFKYYDASIFERANEMLKISKIKNTKIEYLLKVARNQVSQLLSVGYSRMELTKIAEKNFSKMKNEREIKLLRTCSTSFTYHFKPDMRIKNEFCIAFPINHNFFNNKKVNNKLYLENIIESFDHKEFSLEVLNWDKLKEKIDFLSAKSTQELKTVAKYFIINGINTFDINSVLNSTIGIVKWLSGYIKMVSSDFLIDLKHDLVIYQENNPKFGKIESMNVYEYKDGEFLYPIGNISKLVKINNNKNEKIKDFINSSLSVKIGSNSIINYSAFLNNFKIIESFPLEDGFNKIESYSKVLFDLSNLGLIKSSLITYIRHNKKAIKRTLRIELENKEGEVKPESVIQAINGVKNKSFTNEPIFEYQVNKALLELENINLLKNRMFFIIFMARKMRNHSAHKHIKVISQFDNIIINSLDLAISILTFDLIYHVHEFNSNNKKSNKEITIKQIFKFISNDNTERLQKYLKRKKMENIIYF